MEINRTIRVILADDHPVVRRGIRRVLEKAPNIQVVGEAGTGMDALRLVQELKADVILLDQEMPDLKGVQVVRELRTNHLPVSIVMQVDHLINGPKISVKSTMKCIILKSLMSLILMLKVCR